MIIRIESERLFFTGDRTLTIPKTLEIKKGITVLCGKNGSGKSTFAQIISKGRNYRTNKITDCRNGQVKTRIIEFNDIHSLPGVSVEYYQQRYEETMNEDTPTIAHCIGEKIKNPEFKKLCSLFNLQNIEDKKINHLSSGELRKLLIINSLIDVPDLLILDNPYIGLDKQSRQILNEAIFQLKNSETSVMLILQNEKDAPEFTDNFLYADNLKISENRPDRSIKSSKKFGFKPDDKLSNEIICELKNCEIKYNGKTIITNFNWKIERGERWSLSGPNGSGKSTILSLINADNPKGYCNNLYLFGKKRGSGESIWDIKKRIGYISPEMLLHFHGSGTVEELIANGLNDTVGLYIKPSEAQKQIALKWINHFNLNHLKNRIFNTLSSGEKQLVLIARSFIKEPELLILDEPMHALDEDNIRLVEKTLEEFLGNKKNSAFIMVTHRPENLPDAINKKLELNSSHPTNY